MYGQYNMETTGTIIESLNGMMEKQSSLECMMKGLNMYLPVVYTYLASGPGLYGFQLHLYIQAVCERHVNM